MKTVLTHYSGKVQGVGFRVAVLGLARGYDVLGYAKNLPDGRVELLARGEETEVDDFLTAIAESHLAGHIESVKSQAVETTPTPPLRGFQIL